MWIITLIKYLIAIIGLIGVLGLPGSVIFIIMQLIKRKPVNAGFIFIAISFALIILAFIVYAIVFTIEHNIIPPPNAII